MLMLYQFTIDVFDRVYGYPFATDYLLVAGIHEDRVERVRKQICQDRDLVLQRCVLIAARTLTLREEQLVRESSVGSHFGQLLWIAARSNRSTATRSRFYLYTSDELAELEARSPESLDVYLLLSSEYVPSLGTPRRPRAA